jgi:hypothetical protein
MLEILKSPWVDETTCSYWSRQLRSVDPQSQAFELQYSACWDAIKSMLPTYLRNRPTVFEKDVPTETIADKKAQNCWKLELLIGEIVNMESEDMSRMREFHSGRCYIAFKFASDYWLTNFSARGFLEKFPHIKRVQHLQEYKKYALFRTEAYLAAQDKPLKHNPQGRTYVQLIQQQADQAGRDLLDIRREKQEYAAVKDILTNNLDSDEARRMIADATRQAVAGHACYECFKPDLQNVHHVVGNDILCMACLKKFNKTSRIMSKSSPRREFRSDAR